MYFNRKNAEQKNWRMIKKGKHFLFGCSLVFAVGATLATPTVHADNVEAKAEVTAGATQAEQNAEAPTYEAPAATSSVVTGPAETAPVEANSAITAVSVDKSQLELVLAQAKAKNLDGQETSVKAEVAAAIAEAEALVANGSASQEQVNQSVERLTQAVSSVKEVTEVAAETTTEAASEATTESSETPKVRNKRATTEGTSRAVDESRLDRVTVTKDNFDSFFKEGGTANYDETSGTIKLTDDVSGQVGSAYLRFKIDPKEDFTFTGKVDIGDKYEGHTVGGRPGGDGVGFVFHTGNVDTIGQSGASIGMGTIKNAFGFKLDSWHNTSNPNANQNASADPRYGGNAWRSNAFGSFYSSNNAGRVTTSSSAAKALNPAPSGQWVDFKIEYKGQTKEFIVTYGYEKWSTNLKTANASIMEPSAKTALNNSNATYALSFLGSTGSGTNLQRVQIEKFVFTAPQIVQVAFYDEAGNELAASSAIPGDRDQVVNLSNIEAVQKAISKIKAKGYTLKEVNSDKAETYNSGANTVTLRSGGQLLKYVFAVPSPAVTPTLQATGSMTVAGVKSTDNTFSGTGIPGATVTVKVAGATLADNITVGTDGTWTTTLSKGFNSNITNQDQLVPKDSVTITQKIGVSESQATEVAVGLGESTVQPSTDSKDQQSIVAETTTVTLKVPHDAGIAYFDYPNANNGRSEVAIKRDSIPGAWTSKDESKAVVTSYSSDGFFDTIVLEMKEKIQPGKAKVISNIKETKYSSPVGWKEINVEAKPDTTPPVAPTVNPVKAGATAITGTAEAGSTVEVTLPNGQKASAKAGDNGEFSITVPALSVDDQISVTATDAANNKSDATTVTVKENVRPVVTIPYDDKANQIIYLYSGEENNIELKITDNSGKISKAYLVFAQDNRTGLGTEDAGYLNGKTKSALYLKANRFGSETTATEANPAIIKLTANIPNGSYTDGTGMTRYIYAEDLAGNTNYDNVGAAGDTGAPGRIRFVWKPQTFKYNAQAPSTPITSSTLPEASAIEKAVKDANPTFSDKIGSVTLDGTNVKVTYKDGSTDVIPANSVFTIEPTAPTVTPVKNPSSLEQPEKDAVKKAVETANPSATKVEVGTDGTTTLTYSNGSTAKLTPAQTVSQADVTPPVAPTVNAVKAGATSITGTAEEGSTVEVTLPNGQKASAKAGDNGVFSITVPALNADDQISVTATDAANNTSTPTKVTVKETVRPVLNIPYDDAENQVIYVYSGEENNIELKITDNSGKISKAYLVFAQDNRTGLGTEDTGYLNGKTKSALYLKANRFGSETTATETNPAIIKLTANIPNGSYTDGTGMTRYLFAEDAAGNTSYEHVGANMDKGALGRIRFVWKPQTFKYTAVAPSTPITSNTVPEASAIEKAVKDANPTFSDKIGSVTLDGTNVKVTYKDGSTDTLSADSVFTIKPTAPTVTPVKNTSALTTPEKQAVEAAVRTKNPDATTVVVGNDGSTTLTYSNGSTAKLTPAQTVKAADANGVQEPAAKTPVQNTSALTQPEKDAVKKAVEDANPTATKVEVGNDGSATVTFPDGTTATLPGAKTVKEADSKGVQEPAAKTPVQNTSALTQPEKDAVKKAVETANPSATKVEVGDNGDTTVTFPDGTTATLTGDKTVKEADSKGVQEPAAKTPVQNTSALTQPEKDAVKKAVETANPSATKVEVGNDGSATVTFPDGTTATLPGAKTVKEADSKGVQEPAAKTPVQNTSALTQPEKDAVKKAVETANPSATKVEVGDNGDTTVTFPDGTTATLTGDKTVKEADSKGVQEPAAKTPVQNTSALTQPEKDAVKKAVETANPSATKVEVGDNGDTTVTFPDGTTATLTGDKTVKEADSKGVQEPAAKTPVQNTSALTQPEKDAVKKAVEDANPTATKVEVGNDGSATVTFPDGTTATLTGDKTVKEADSKGVQEPAAKTPVQNTSALTQPEKDAVKKAVEDANPTATKVEVGNDGSATVTFPDGTTATLTGDKTVKEADSKGVQEPAAKTPVQNTSALTQPEKDAVKKAVEDANPTATKVEVGNDGSATVTFPDGTTATLTGDKTVKEADSKGVQEPAAKTPVQNTSALTQPEKDAVKKAVEDANPTATKVEVGNDGSATVTFPDGTTATLPGAKTVKEADSKGVQEPAAKTPVQNTSALTQPEKDAVKKAVETANPSATKVEVGDNGDTTVTFPDGTTATLPGAKTVKEADSKGVQEPAAKTPVQNTSALTQPEKDAVKKAVETANPSATKVEVGDNGDTTVTFPDGTTATLPGAKTVKEADSKGVQEPAAKTPVQNTSALTQPEKDAVKKAVETANPSATKVEVGDNGDTTVTFPDGTTATLTGDKTVKEADSKGVQEPAAKTPVQNTSALTQPEKDAVKKAVETANPSATKVEVGDNGDTTVTFPDGTTATLPGAKTVKEADSKGVQEPAAKTPVQNTSALTQPEKDAVKKAVETANPSATKVEVGDNGDTTVTFPDGTTATLTGDKTVKEADSKGVQEPAAKTPVQNTSALTQPEKDAVKKAVETANPSATKVEVGNDGSATVTFPDGTTATLPGAKTVKEADSKGVQEPAAKTPVQNTSALTQPEKDAVKKAVETANPSATKVEVGDNGDTTVTFPDGTTATLPGAKTVKEADSKGVQEPAAKTPVQNTSALTQPEKDAVKKAVETANPSATKVEVGDNGDTTVTFPDGTTATLPGAKTVKEADSKGVQEPAAKTPVQNTSALTQPEKDAVKKAVEDANPTATKVEVGNDGSATVTFPDGTTATLTGDKTVKEADSKGVQEPAAKTPVQNTSALTQPEKDAVKKAVETANPSATKVEVGDNGDTTVTFPDGTTATLTGDKTVKEADSKGVQEPAAKTPVQNTSALTQPEKDAVKKAVETANPSATKVEVGDNGDTTVTFPDGTTATLPGAKTVKEADSKGVQEPAAKTPVQNTSALTQPEKDAVKKAVETANPSATKVEVGDNGDTTVTFPDGTTATLPGAKTVKEADSKGVQEPAAKTPVQNTSALTQPEKDAVKKAVETANPSATKVEVGDNGDTTVTFPDGTTATLPGAKTVKEADSKGVQEPAAKTPVQNTSALTQPEKDAVKKAVETANPSATKVEVGDNGDTTVTFPDGTTATLPGAKTVKEADSKGVQEPAAKTPVQNTSALTQPEKDAVKKAVETANPSATKVEVGDNGDTTVTFPDGTTATLPGAKTVKEADSKGVQEPAAKTPVQNTSALTQPEKDAVKKAVETANPSATKVEVGDNGDTTVTFPDGTTATLPGAKTVKEADSKGVQEPAAKTPVQNTSALTQPEKDAVKKAVETANPSATKVEVGNDGSATVTFPDGTTATLPGAKTVKEADSKGVQEPAAKTPVQNTSALTQPEKDAVKKAVETANPSATKVEVGNDGSATVTFPDGTTATLPGAKTVKEADSKGVQEPAAKTPVQNTSALTQPEKDAVKKAVETANPSATKVEVGDNGDTTVTFPDGTTATLPGAKTVKEADSKGVQEPAAKTPVQNTSALTQPEKDAVKKAVETANPSATKVEVGDNGDTTVTFPDGTTATLPGAKTVKEADSKGVQEPAAKTPVQNTSALTQPEKDAVKKAVEDANPTATKVEVGNDGSATVTFPDGTTATLTGDKTVKEADSKGVQEPAAKTPVQNTSALTQPEKDAVKKAVEDANPTATKVEVGNDGSATVTFPDGTTATLPGAKTVKEADSKGVQEPAAKTPVQNTSALTQPEKDAVKKAVETANPSATKVEVGDNGDTTVTFPDGTTATLPGAKTVKEADSKGVQEPAAKTPVQNTSALTQPEKDAVKKAVETANPSATKVEVGDNGDTTVTFPDGTTATLPGAKTVKEADSKGVQEPAAKTPVQNTSALTQPEKDAVKKAVETANPSATKVEVGDNGDTTVTFPDGTTATLPGAKTVKEADSKGVQEPAAKTPVQNTSALTQPEKDAVKKAVETANPSATKVEVGDNGDTTVTFPDGTTATLPGAKTVKEADSKGVQEPAAKTPVQNTSALTQPEKDAVKKAVETANPSATKVEVGDNGDTTVTFPDGTTATLPGAKTVKEADSKGVQEPAAKTPVQNTSALTQPEKDAVKKAVETANPSATKVEVGNDGSATVTFPDGTTATLPGAKTVKEADSKGVQEPAAKTPVQNTSALTQPEKDAVKKAVETANPSATKVEVGNDGSATVTFPDGTTATLPGAKTVKEADSKGVQEPAAKTPVQNTSALTQPEKDAVKKAVETANPSATKVEVGDNGDTTVTFPDGTTATLTGDKTVKEADSKGVQEPAAKTPVQNTSALTQPEKDAVKKAVEDANPTATKVEVGNDGSATVTFPDGTTATLTGDKTVKEADSKGVQEPAAKTPVQNTSALTQPEKDAVKKAVEDANPTATKVEVGNDGSATVTFPDGTTATLTGDKTVKEADSKGVQEPAAKTPVQNTSALTQPEKDAVKKAVEDANPTATKVEVGNDGSATVTFPDGTTATLTGDKTVKEADSKGVQEPAAKTPVQNTSALTQPEKDAVKKAVEDANPTATKVEVGNDGSATVTFPDGTTATLPGAKTVKEADSKGVQEPAAKTPVQNTSALTQPEKDAVKKAVETANPSATKVEVGDNGDTTVTFPDGTTATLPGAKTVKEADSKGVQEPAAKTPVQNTSALTQPEKDAVKKAVETANPSATKVEVGDNGDTTVTFPDGTTATLPGAKTVYTSERGELPDSFDLPKLIITKWIDEEGNELKPANAKAPTELGESNEAFEHGEIDGYVFVRTLTDEADGNVTHVFRKLQDATAPTAPVVNPVKAGDTAVTGTAEAGSTVEVTLPDGTKATATADQDGNFSVPVSGLEEGQTVSVTAKDASNNTSAPTTATVAKADDKTAPTAPVVNPVKAGDTAVTGTAEAGSTVEVTLPDGTKATATADQDGNFSVPVSGLEEGQTVSVTAKDASNNTSAPTTATVAKADDKTAPTAPVVNPVKAGDTAVTGTAEAGSTVEVTLPDGTKATATADQDGNFSVPVSGLEEGQTVSVTAKDASNNTSAPTTATVAKADDKTAPTAPVVNPVKAGDTAVTGTAEAGSTVEVTLPDGTKATATADQDGNFSVPVSGLEEGQTVSVTAKDASNNTSAPTTATVAKADDKTAPTAPVVNPVKAGDTAVTGTAEAGSTVEVTLPDGTKATATADQDGNFSVPVSGLEEGQTVSVTAKDASNNTSAPTTATVAKADDKTAPTAPVVNPVKAGDTAVTGTAEAGSTVEVTLPDGTKATATADQDGNFSVPVSGLEEGQTVSVTAKDASNNTSAPTTATVAKADDKTAPTAPVVNPVKAGDTAVTGTAEAGSTVEVTLPDGTKATATADQDGNFSVPVSGLEEGQTVSVTAKDASNNTSAPTTATVAKADDKTAPDAPVVNPVKAGDTAVTGTAEAGSTVEVTLPDGTKATATADQDGNFSVPVSGLEEGQTVSVTATDAAKNTSAPTTATVAKADDKTAPTAPVVNPVKAGDTAVTGTAEAGSTVEVTLPDGTKATATADQDGNFSVPVSGLEEGQTVSVTAKDASNNTSAPTTATVAKADDKTAPTAPVVNPVKAGDTAVTGTAEAGSTVEVTLPDGTKATATADKDGKFSIPVNGLNAGDTVSVTATDESGNTSATTTVTVSNVNVGGKEADNAKVPALTPVVDPNNLTDAEKAKVAEEVKKSNPTAKDIKVNNDGSVVVTFEDGSVAVIPAEKAVAAVNQDSPAQEPAKKAGAKELPNTGTKQSNASLGLALLAAVTGGLLISKKREEEE